MRILLTGLVVCLMTVVMPTFDAEAQQVFNEPVEITSATDGLGIGRDAAGRPLRIQAPALPSAVFNIETPNGLANIFQMNANGNGSGFMWLKTSDNTVRIQINSDLTGNSFFNAGNVGFGTTNPQTRVDVSGTTRTTVLEITGGSDLAEQFDISGESAEPGSVVCIDPEKPGALLVSSRAYDRSVAGIISGAGGLKSGMKMGQDGTEADGKHPVALTGRVYVKADASNGAIQPGDLLTTSSLPGHAMKVTDHVRAQGAIIGKSMTALNSETGLVLVLVSLQ